MKLTFANWLRNSNETTDLRIAYALFDDLPKSLGPAVLIKIHDVIRCETERRWAECKVALDIE